MPRATIPQRGAMPGGEIAYDEYYFGKPWIEPEPLVLVHGFSKNRRFFYEWVPALARHYRVFRLDLRGHGESSPLPADFRMDVAPFADDMAAFLDALGLKSAHWVMAEFSSSVAVDFAVRHPERIRCLVLPGFGYTNRGKSPRGDSDETNRILREQGSEAWARATNRNRLPADAPREIKEWYISEQARVPASFLMKVMAYAPTVDFTDLLPKIQAPTLMMGGSAARQGPAENLYDAQKLIPRNKLVVFEGMPFNVMTACPGACIRETLAFLEESGARPVS